MWALSVPVPYMLHHLTTEFYLQTETNRIIGDTDHFGSCQLILGLVLNR